MNRRTRIAGLLGLGAVALSLSLAAPAMAQPGPGSHFFCNKLVAPRSACSGFDGVAMGVGFYSYIYGDYPGKSPIEICVLDDIYRRSPSGFVKRFKVCGLSSASRGGVVMRYSDVVAQGGLPSDFNGLNYFEVAQVYNRSSYTHTLEGAAIGTALY